MKKVNLKLYFLIVLVFVTINGMAQVGIGTTSPDDSSMLDIQSTSKGVLIPRMTTTQRNLVSGVEGLLVFDSSTKSFWYYNSGWVELAADSGTAASDKIEDADGDTRVEVEKVADTDPDGDEINFTTRDVERMKIGNDGVIFMGDSINGNYTKVTTDGSLSYEGDATRWDDLKVPVNSVKISKDDVLDVEYDIFMGQIAVLYFNNDAGKDKEESVMFTVQMPHAWKEGTAIRPHVHWVSESSVGDDKVEWVLEYSWASLGQVFPTSEKLSSTTVVDGGSGDSKAGADEHVITPLGSITATGKTLSSMLVCRLYRDVTNGSNDTFGRRVGLLEIDFHYQIDSDGSNEEYTKY